MLKKLVMDKSKITKRYEQAANNSLVRAGIQLIPHIGGAMDVLLFDKASKIKEKRILQSLKVLAKSKII